MTRRRRELTPDDKALWRRVIADVAPLRPEDGQARSEPEPVPRPAPEAPSPAAPSFSPPIQKATPRLAPLDRRLMRRVARGSAGVEAALDLHGLTQAQAHRRLLDFLRTSRAAGRRLVLVVTGKGLREPRGDWWEAGARGVLRRAVPEWLSTPEFREHVAGYETAHGSKGGEGALYVLLRRDRSGGR